MNATGTNTAQRTRAIAMIGPLTSSIALWLASTGLRPSSMCRSTFSTTTMASSTTMPIASTSPNSDNVLTENPDASITANVPTIEIGTAASGITEARHVCRNSTTTMTTMSVASSNVRITSRMESRTNVVGSYTAAQSIPCGKRVLRSSILARTPLDSASALDPGAWNTTMATADL